MLPPGVTVFERGWLSANNILFTGGERTALVDSGYWTHEVQTVALVEGALGARPLDLLLSTHLHSDHCGGNAALQRRYPGVETRVPPGLARFVSAWDPVALTYQPTGQHCPRFRLDGLLVPGASVELGGTSWQVHSAPGHDPHSVILFEPVSRTLISADALWENGFGVVFQELEGERAFDEVGATLDLIEGLRPAVVIPGHGPVFADAVAALANARRRLDSFVRDPAKHAQHAAKVLLKFKLLELQQVPESDLLGWAGSTPYFGMVHARYFADRPAGEWVAGLVGELLRSGAAVREGGLLGNG
ncbi:MBL fold metallo-hydrolase [Ramlibacter albus]|uniref:MBL fold metallo-hydrolase n=1 Tax=Ramlibacter albus TaxID=2079448 RepID=A0A923S184_9BURK|nr:MBL fold metallo-hydrolase [Ramlibacter albus]MBC5763388.1 MBL fold metallo-hydrolase [Ramlibacter albus]